MNIAAFAMQAVSPLVATPPVTSPLAAAWITAEKTLQVGIRIALIVLIAFVLRVIITRAIRKLTQRTIDGESPVMRGRTGRAIAKATGLIAQRRRQRAETMRSVLSSVVSIFLFAIALMLILGELGINLGPILASAGIVGVALGFGAQNLIKDYLNGICMILEDQYGVGDQVDLGEAIGTIEAVGLRTTRVRDVEGIIWYVRNGEIVRVANSSQGAATIILDLPVAHGTDLDRAQAAMTEALIEFHASPERANEFIDEPQVQGVQAVTPAGITLRAVLTVVPGARYSAAREGRGRITEAFQRAGITPPSALYPPGPTEQ